jgi:hypothetical protein
VGPFTLAFSDCVVDSGIIQSDLGGDQITYSITGCRIAGGVTLSTPEQITVANNEIQGPVRAGASSGLYLLDNTIEGPGNYGFYGTFKDLEPVILRNTVRGFDVGISLSGTMATYVRDNLVESCPLLGIEIHAPWYLQSVTGNRVRTCGYGIQVYAEDQVLLASNVVEDCGAGIYAAAGYTEVTANRVLRCGTGLFVEPGYPGSGVASRRNVVEGCGGGLTLWSYSDCVADRDTVIGCAEGILLRSEYASAIIDSALVVSSRGTGITIEAYSASATRCVVGRSRLDGIRLAVSAGITLSGNTSYLNGGSGFAISDLEAASGGAAGNVGFGNLRHGISTDQLVNLQLSCNDWFGNVAGATAGLSPGATDLAVHPMFCDLSSDDVHLASGSPLASAPGCGLIGAHGIGCASGQTTGVIDASPAISGFGLARVGPVPTHGPVALEWTMPHAAAIDVTVHDVQGRAVARIASGDWPAGRHAIEWNGEGAGGRLPPGLYLIRYRHPGGETSRRIVISR